MGAAGHESDITSYDGLVFKTAQMYAQQVGLELDDMQQELRIKVLKAKRAYNPERSKMTERAYVYGCLANFVKDLKRDAARRRNGRLVVVHVADEATDWFEFTFQHISHEQVFGAVEDGAFLFPATITEREREVILLMVIGYTPTEIALCLEVTYTSITAMVRGLRGKFADWRPTPAAPVALPQAPVQHPVAA